MQIQLKGLDDIKDTLDELEQKTTDLKPLLRELANHLVNVTQESFENEVSPDGTDWSPIKFRKSDKTPTKILYDRGHLQKTLYSRVYKNSFTVGINATVNDYQYPLVHQFGSLDGTTKARPFMPIKVDGELYEDTKKELDEIVSDYFEIMGLKK